MTTQTKSSSAVLSKVRRLFSRRRIPAVASYEAYTPISFSEVNAQAQALADIIEQKFEDLADILLEYESFEVVQDEVERTLDLLRNLGENKQYFQLRIGDIAAFLPRNQPLYAFTCFVVVPSLMAHEVHFRIPRGMRNFFPKMLTLLDVPQLFPNIIVSHRQRLEFLRERSALLVDSKTGESIPVTDAVIFTGNSVHAEQLRIVFDDHTLFIMNGSGHNPVVVSKDADLAKAAEAVLTLQLYNQGQDCAAPNAVLVHEDIYTEFLSLLRDGLRSVGIGHYRDRLCRVGPISDPRDLVRIQDFLIHHQGWLDSGAPGIIRAREAIVEPTLICKPLHEGGNFTEIFAPIIFVQRYKDDSELSLYFEDSRYAQNAMYVTLYGTSKYIDGLINKTFEGKVLQDAASILYNTHPHARGIERGTQLYGGYGYKASSLTIRGKIICKPTLPQRDIFEHVAKPILHGPLEEYRERLKKFTKIAEKNVEKLLRLAVHDVHPHSSTPTATHETYIDLRAIPKGKDLHYAKIDEKYTYQLLEHPNVAHLSRLKLTDIELIRALCKLLKRRDALEKDDFGTLLYALAAKPGSSQRENRNGQLIFFKHLYQLLFGKDSGPRLTQFLKDVDTNRILKLLDV